MNTRSHHMHFRGIVAQVAISLAVVLALGAGTILAADVNCDSSGSIQAFLSGLDKSESRTVTISGTCTESVIVEGFRDLTLSGGTIQRPLMTQWPGALPALLIKSSDRVSINSLTFHEQGPGGTGNQPLVSILRSNVVLQDCTVSGSDWDGLAIGDHSSVDIWRSIFEDNKGTGVSVVEDSRVNVSYVWWDEARTIIRRNGSGINAGSSAVANVVHVSIEDNSGGAVNSNAGALVNLGGWGEWAPTIEGNGTKDTPAVGANGGGEIWIIPPTIIRKNLGDGASATMGGRLIVCCGEPTKTPITDNGGFGLAAWTGGGLFFWAAPWWKQTEKEGLASPQLRCL